MPAAAKHAKSKTARKLVAEPHEHLTIAAGNALNAGPVVEWLLAMRERQERRSNINEWVSVVSDLSEACRKFGASQAPWLSAIVGIFNSEPRSLSLFVVPKSQDDITLDVRRAVASFGLAVGGAFNVRCEARLCYQQPENTVVFFQR